MLSDTRSWLPQKTEEYLNLITQILKIATIDFNRKNLVVLTSKIYINEDMWMHLNCQGLKLL
jgi:hypothetical protein